MNREALCQSVFKAAAALPEGERAAFDEAREKAPELIVQESDPLAFIRFAGGNHAAAARGLVAYWGARKSTFEDRFLLPLDLSGQGALSEDDVETLKTGFITILPDDCCGRKVIYFDNAMSNKLLDGMSRRAPRFRCLFYMSAMAAKEGKPCVLIRFSNSTKMYLHKAELILGLFNSLPVHLSLFLNLYQAPSGARRMFESTVVSIFEDFKDRESYRDVLKSIIGDTPRDLLVELSEFGLVEDCVPPSIGGTWNCSSHDNWLLTRVTEDRVRRCSGGGRVEGGKPLPESSKRKAPEANLDDLLVMKARAERKRMMDRKYSEQRRQREKKEESTLYNQYVKLNAKNKELRAEEKRLQALLSEAQSKQQELESPQVARHEPAQFHHAIEQHPSNDSAAASAVGNFQMAQLFQQRHQEDLLRSLLAASIQGHGPPPPARGADLSAMLKLVQQQVPAGSNFAGGLASPVVGPQVRPTTAQGQHPQVHALYDLLANSQLGVGNS